jgi:hypothetical protein
MELCVTIEESTFAFTEVMANQVGEPSCTFGTDAIRVDTSRMKQHFFEFCSFGVQLRKGSALWF